MPSFFPMWVVITHFLNLFFMLLLFRSGAEVLSAFPKLYWHEDCPPGREWLRLSKVMHGSDSRKPWSSLDEEESWSPVVALPGRKNLGLGRHWHFMSIQFWILTGLVYVVMVFVTGYWHYLVPTHWSIIPDSIRSIGTYLHFELPAKISGEPFEPVFAGVIVLHVAMVSVHGLPKESAAIVPGDPGGNRSLALGIGPAGLFAILVLHIVISWFSLRYRRRTQRLLGFMVNPFERAFSRTLPSNSISVATTSRRSSESTAFRRQARTTSTWPRTTFVTTD